MWRFEIFFSIYECLSQVDYIAPNLIVNEYCVNSLWSIFQYECKERQSEWTVFAAHRSLGEFHEKIAKALCDDAINV